MTGGLGVARSRSRLRWECFGYPLLSPLQPPRPFIGPKAACLHKGLRIRMFLFDRQKSAPPDLQSRPSPGIEMLRVAPTSSPKSPARGGIILALPASALPRSTPRFPSPARESFCGAREGHRNWVGTRIRASGSIFEKFRGLDARALRQYSNLKPHRVASPHPPIAYSVEIDI